MANSVQIYLTGYSWCDNFQSAYTSTGHPGSLRDGTWDEPTTAAFDEKLLKGQYGGGDKRPILYLDCQLLSGTRALIKKYVRLEDKCGHGWYWTHVTLTDELLARITASLNTTIDNILKHAPPTPPGSGETADVRAARFLKAHLGGSGDLIAKYKAILGYGDDSLGAPMDVSIKIEDWFNSACAPYCEAAFLSRLFKEQELYQAGKRDWVAVGRDRARLNELEQANPQMQAAVTQTVQRVLRNEPGTRIVFDVWYGYHHNALKNYTGFAMANLSETTSKNEKIFPYIKGRVVDDATGQPIVVADPAACLDTQDGQHHPPVSDCTSKIYSKIKVSLIGVADQNMFTTCGGRFALLGDRALGPCESYKVNLSFTDTSGKYIDVPSQEVTVHRSGTSCEIRLKLKSSVKICKFHGVVLDGSAPREKPLPMAKVAATGADGYNKKLQAKVDGSYDLEVPFGSLQLKVDYPNWISATETVTINKPEQQHKTTLMFDPDA